MTSAQDEFEECLDLARQLLTGSDEIDDLWEANDLCNRALRLRPRDSVAWLVKGQALLTDREVQPPVPPEPARELAGRS